MLKKWALFSLFLCLCSCNFSSVPSPVAMIRVSSDGKYALSTHYGRYLILWDIEKQTKQILNQHTNVFSPYFIPNSHTFLWQDANSNEVFLQTVKGEVLQSFKPDFAVYGHVMNSKYDNYVACDLDWNLYQFQNKQQKLIKPNDGGSSYLGAGKLMNMSLVHNHLLTSGLGSGKESVCTLACGSSYKTALKSDSPYNTSLWDTTILWDMNTGKPKMKFLGTFGKTVATLSPDNKYVVDADEQGLFFLWDTKYGKRTRLKDPTNPDLTCYDHSCLNDLAEEMRTNKVIPDDFYSHPFANGERNVAVKFIDENGHLIRFINSVNYATLYSVKSPKVQAYMDFGKNPQPNVFSVFRSANVIDTAPKAKILVMGQSGVGTNDKDKTTGLIVYRFDDKTKTLQRIWAPQGPPPHKRIINPDNRWEY